jgi:GT2 family glycosyltransferase
VWNRRDLLESLLCNLRRQTHPIAQVLVVDDGSAEDPAEIARAGGAQCIRMGAHGGFAKAVNRGLAETRTPLAAILNNDVEPAPDWLARLAAALSPDVWFATGRILQAADPARIDATYDAVCRGGTPWRVGHGCLDGPAFRQARRIWSAPFTAALFRTALFEKIGMLDERFESYLEDVDFGLRCARAECAGLYVPEAVAWHQGSATLGRWNAESTRLTARNQLFLVAKHYPARLRLRYAWPIIVAQGLWGLVALRHGRGWAWMQGKLEGLRRSGEFRNTSSSSAIAGILCQGELEIRRMAEPSRYWKLYFMLTRVRQSDTS